MRPDHDPTHRSVMAPVKAIVIFRGDLEFPWFYLLKPGFRHCFILWRIAGGWVVMDPLCGRLMIKLLPPYSVAELIQFYATKGAVPVPVIASVGSDREGNSYNINADEAAGKVAAALGAFKVIFLTDIVGWLSDPEDETSRISVTDVAEVEAALESISGGMRPKLTACVNAIRGGAQNAYIIDGRRPHSLLLELFTDAGIGTMVTP